MEWKRGYYRISDDSALLDLDAVADMLLDSYRAPTRTREVIVASFRNSLAFGVYRGAETVAVARVVTDRAVFSWLCDVVVRQDLRGQGLGKWLVECVLEHPAVRGTKMWLATRDAHELYGRFGFTRAECMMRQPG